MGEVKGKVGTARYRRNFAKYEARLNKEHEKWREKGLSKYLKKITRHQPKVLDSYFELLVEFERFLRDGVEKIMISTGVPKDADILKTIDVSYQKELFQVLAMDYYQYLSKGRRPRARKVPIQALIQWIKDKNIPYKGSINNAAFAIQQTIYKFGIVGHNYEEAVLDFTTQAISEYTSLYLADMTDVNIISPFYNFKNNKFIAIGVEFGEIHKAVAL